MSDLQDFLALPDVSDITKEIYINEQFGTFKVKPATEEQWSNYRNRCRSKIGKKGVDFNVSKFNLLVVAGHIIEPNFSDAEFLSQVGCSTAGEFIARKFLPGIIQDIADKIAAISGFDAEDNDINEKIEEAKD